MLTKNYEYRFRFTLFCSKLSEFFNFPEAWLLLRYDMYSYIYVADFGAFKNEPTYSKIKKCQQLRPNGEIVMGHVILGDLQISYIDLITGYGTRIVVTAMPDG